MTWAATQAMPQRVFVCFAALLLRTAFHLDQCAVTFFQCQLATLPSAAFQACRPLRQLVTWNFGFRWCLRCGTADLHIAMLQRSALLLLLQDSVSIISSGTGYACFTQAQNSLQNIPRSQVAKLGHTSASLSAILKYLNSYTLRTDEAVPAQHTRHDSAPLSISYA